MLAPLAAHAQSASLAVIPDGTYATQAWHGERPGDGFVYVLGPAGRPRGMLFQPHVRDLGVLQRDEAVRLVQARAEGEHAEIVVEPVRAASGEVVAYVVRPADIQLTARFNGSGGFTLYARGGHSTIESCGGGGGAGGM